MKKGIIFLFVVLIMMIVLPLLLLDEGDFSKKWGFGSSSNKDDAVIEDLREKLPQGIKPVVTDKKLKVYKWVDEFGVMQFSSTPPFEGDDYESMLLSPDINIMEAVKVSEKEPEEARQAGVVNVGNPYSPESVEKLVGDTKNIEGLLGERQSNQEKMLQDLLKQK